METEPRTALDRMVSLRGKIDSSELSPENRARLLRGVDRDIREMQSYIEKNLPDIVTGEENSARLNSMEMSRERKYEAERQVQKLVERSIV